MPYPYTATYPFVGGWKSTAVLAVAIMGWGVYRCGKRVCRRIRKSGK